MMFEDDDEEWDTVYIPRCKSYAKENPDLVESWKEYVRPIVCTRDMNPLSTTCFGRITAVFVLEPPLLPMVKNSFLATTCKVVVDVLCMPLEDVPLYVGSKTRIVRDTAHWRLETGE